MRYAGTTPASASVITAAVLSPIPSSSVSRSSRARSASSTGSVLRTTSRARTNALVLNPVSCARSRQWITRSSAASGVIGAVGVTRATLLAAREYATGVGAFQLVLSEVDGTTQEIELATSTLTNDTFETTVKADGITLVDFWASWCGPCRQFGPIFEATAEENPDVTFAKVDTEAEQQLAGALGIMSIPTLMIFRDGIQLFNRPGALPKSALDDLLRQVRELDMDEVRQQLAEQSQHQHVPCRNHVALVPAADVLSSERGSVRR